MTRTTLRLRMALALLLLAAPLLLTTVARADALLPRPGEVALSGTIRQMLPQRTGLVLLVGTLTRPDGSSTPLDPARPKTVLSPSLSASLKPGDALTAIGKDAGVGKPLTARRLILSLEANVPGALPVPWKDADIGKVGVPGSAQFQAGTFTVTASGEDMFGPADSFHFVYQPLSGNGQIIARVVQYQRKDQWTKVGVMVRETIQPGSKFADLLVTPDNGAEFQHRNTTNGDTQTTDQVPSPTPYWVKLVRAGDMLTGYVSKDGQTWEQRGQDSIPMAPDVLVGLCVTSHKNDVTTEAKIDSVTVGK